MPGFSGCLQQLVAYEVPMHYQNYTTLLKKLILAFSMGYHLQEAAHDQRT